MKIKSNYDNNYHQLKTDNGDDKNCVLKFSQCDENKYQMWNLKKEDLKIFINYAKKVEKLPWREIKCNKGLHYEKLEIKNIPDYIDKSTSICSMRADDKFRIVGYRSDFYFYIIWFDKNHETC